MHNPPLILIVDDDPNFREIFSTGLKAEGFATETATNGAEGVEKVHAIHPDLVLMDVQMPVMDGVTAFMKLKEEPENHDLKVAFLTVLGDTRAEIQEVDRRFSKELGAAGYMRKTDPLDDLFHRIKTLALSSTDHA